MAADIKRFTAGSNDTLLGAARANELVDLLNLIKNMTVAPSGAGTLKVSQGNAVLDLSGLNGQTHVFNYVVIDGELVQNVAIPCTILPDDDD